MSNEKRIIEIMKKIDEEKIIKILKTLDDRIDEIDIDEPNKIGKGWTMDYINYLLLDLEKLTDKYAVKIVVIKKGLDKIGWDHIVKNIEQEEYEKKFYDHLFRGACDGDEKEKSIKEYKKSLIESCPNKHKIIYCNLKEGGYKYESK